ncbi:unnamed protein product [Caenorhabditis auriculariae]|uniref:Secreted protein n=1 Tax=Caenorhabditis auriculariae TaxID=2777116 RepID=A0A8S1HIB5_9PELO|nr:unnamed protein product [Caenorhabditis auriculariae]
MCDGPFLIIFPAVLWLWLRLDNLCVSVCLPRRCAATSSRPTATSSLGLCLDGRDLGVPLVGNPKRTLERFSNSPASRGHFKAPVNATHDVIESIIAQTSIFLIIVRIPPLVRLNPPMTLIPRRRRCGGARPSRTLQNLTETDGDGQSNGCGSKERRERMGKGRRKDDLRLLLLSSMRRETTTLSAAAALEYLFRLVRVVT